MNDHIQRGSNFLSRRRIIQKIREYTKLRDGVPTAPVGSRFGKGWGFSLVEVTIAMGLVSFCLVAMLGVLPVGLEQERTSADQLVAAQVLAAIASDFRGGRDGAGKTLQYKILTTSGSEDVFYVDDSFNRTTDEAEASHSVSVRMIAAVPPRPDSPMHVFVSRFRPGATSSGSGQKSSLADAVVQGSIN